MRQRLWLVVIVIAAIGGWFAYSRSARGDTPAATGPAAARTGGGAPGGAGGGTFRPPMTVQLATVSRGAIAEHLTVVGNLVGAATVDVVPKVNGRLQSVNVRIGDAVRRGSTLALVEDREIREQVKQSEAAFDVARATIRQREADLRFAQTNVERSRSLFQRQLLPQQTLDDAEARHQAASAQLELARAQFAQSQARLEELKITLSNTRIVSPVDGFVGKRNLDPGAFVSPNNPVVSVVDIRTVRLVTNLVERDLRRVGVGEAATVDVDAFPGETFKGRVARVAPVLDPATRTAAMEIEIPNPTFRLKPGMYARVRLTVAERPNVLLLPRNAVVDTSRGRGVFVFDRAQSRVAFAPVTLGLQDESIVELASGVAEGVSVVTTGAAGLSDGDKVVLENQNGPKGAATPDAGASGAGRGSGAPGTRRAPAGATP